MNDQMQVVGLTGFGLKFPLQAMQVLRVGCTTVQVGTTAWFDASFWDFHSVLEMHRPWKAVVPEAQQRP